MVLEPAPSTPLLQAVRLRVTAGRVRVRFELVRPWTGPGIFVAGLRAGDAQQSIIRHLTLTLDGGTVGEVATYDFLTGRHCVHSSMPASCAGTTITACFPRSSLAGLGIHPRITGFSSLDGHELQSNFPVDRQDPGSGPSLTAHRAPL